jgi:hypothetical protein
MAKRAIDRTSRRHVRSVKLPLSASHSALIVMRDIRRNTLDSARSQRPWRRSESVRWPVERPEVARARTESRMIEELSSPAKELLAARSEPTLVSPSEFWTVFGYNVAGLASEPNTLDSARSQRPWRRSESVRWPVERPEVARARKEARNRPHEPSACPLGQAAAFCLSLRLDCHAGQYRRRAERGWESWR